MINVRIGNDIPLLWKFYSKDSGGQLVPFILTGRNLKLYMIDPLCHVTTVTSSAIITGNQIAWTYPGASQQRVGGYSFTLVENDGQGNMHTIDKVTPFALVPVQETVQSGDSYPMTVSTVNMESQVSLSGVIWGDISGTLADQSDLATALAGKQAIISDIDTIRSNAAAGAAKVSCTDGTVGGFGYIKKTVNDLDNYYLKSQVYNNTEVYNKGEVDEALEDYTTTADLNTRLAAKQDVISDLATIRSNASEGAAKVSCTDIQVATYGYIKNTVADLVNYYRKSEAYTKTEVDSIVAAIKQFQYEVVSVLPSASASTMGKIYLVPAGHTESGNVKNEFITIDNGVAAATRYTWEQIGSTSIDLSDYVTISMLNQALANYTTTSALTALLATKQDNLVSGSNIKTVNGASILGSGNIVTPQGTVTDVKVNGTSVVSSGVAAVSCLVSGDIASDADVSTMLNELFG